MDNIHWDSKIEELSGDWKIFWKAIGNQKEVVIDGIREEYFGMLLGLLSKNKKIVCITHDYVAGKRLAMMMKNWGQECILMPFAWSQMDREELLSIGKYLNRLSKSDSSGIVIVSAEEWNMNYGFQLIDEKIVTVGDLALQKDIEKQLFDRSYTKVKRVGAPAEWQTIGESVVVWLEGEKNLIRIEWDEDRKAINKIEEIDQQTGEILKSKKKLVMHGSLLRKDDSKTKLSDLLSRIKWDKEVVFDSGHMGENIDKWNCCSEKLVIGALVQKNKQISWPIKPLWMWQSGRENFCEVIASKKARYNIIVTKHPKVIRQWIAESNMKFSDLIIIENEIYRGGWIEKDSMMIWSDFELFGEQKKEYKDKKDNKINIKKLAEFKVGDLVVHSDHGIGFLKDYTTREWQGIVKDYLVIGYSGGDLLYVPIEQINKVAKYIGSKLIKLNRLGGVIWSKRKKRAKKQAQEMAKELLSIYAQRKLVHRNPYRENWEKERLVADKFQFELTPDQELAWEDITRDMVRSWPMDRLLCGDVGFGKTELALRLTAKTVFNQKQVAVLAPTTILVEQHFTTFSERMADLGIRVRALSRLRDKAEQKNVIDDLKKGKVDVLIGTHRLLQKDILFKDLGLLIIDEEQKFGVRAKDQLKKLRPVVDILSMSATPIPRTMNMAMGGVRDLSVIETAPQGRRSVQTEVVLYSEEIIADAIRRELDRGGQVFVVHNRVRTIEQSKLALQELLGDDVQIGIAHGKLDEKKLAQTMSAFAKGEYQVLLATTIVENGLDLPNVNTLIVENAAGLGLSQLYQLRGRVGRANRKAYAYFLYRSDKLHTKAKQRLSALAEATELGSGMKLAVADMEIRGVGNMLGLEQHGNAYAVGLGMYLDMLDEAVRELRSTGEKIELSEEQVWLDLPMSFGIPSHYIVDRDKRLSWEQRIMAQMSVGGVDKVANKIRTEHGVWPEMVENMFNIAKIKILAQKNRIKKVYCEKNLANNSLSLVMQFIDEISLDKVQKLISLNKNWLFRTSEALVSVDTMGTNWLAGLTQVLENILT